jgi:hypothetical protein
MLSHHMHANCQELRKILDYIRETRSIWNMKMARIIHEIDNAALVFFFSTLQFSHYNDLICKIVQIK